MENLEKYLNKYITRGFGSMNKNDFEVFIFGELLSLQQYKGKSNYELSLVLRIPESKVKRLRYESALKSANSTEDYNEHVKCLLQKAQLRNENKKILFQVEDVMLKLYIASLLKEDGRVIDNSFNPEVIVLHYDDYGYLLKRVYAEDEVEEALNKAKEVTKKDLSWSDLIEVIVSASIKGLVGGATKHIIDLSLAGIIKIIQSLYA